MDRINRYRTIIEKLLGEYASHPIAVGEIQTEFVVDSARNHFELIDMGWLGDSRVHGIIIHIDIVGDKVWLQHDSTDLEVADRLVEEGIPADDIVLGFRPPHLRQHTGFAVA